MIVIEADFNRLHRGRLVLSRLAIHVNTPFAELARSGDRIVFVQGEEVVEGKLSEDPDIGWVGEADWDTQGILRAYPQDWRELASSAR